MNQRISLAIIAAAFSLPAAANAYTPWTGREVSPYALYQPPTMAPVQYRATPAAAPVYNDNGVRFDGINGRYYCSTPGMPNQCVIR